MIVSRPSLIVAALCAMTLASTACAQSTVAPAQQLAQATTTAPPAQEEYQPSVGQAGKDVVWVPTPQALVDRMLEMAKVTPQDRLVDLGSGDGRTVITAAKRGIKARGIEYNPDMVALAKRAAKAEGVDGMATFERADIFESDFSEATVVTLFLLPQLNLKLRPTLLDMPPGTRVVSNTFTMDDWQPDQTASAIEGCTGYCSAHLWIVPAKAGGTWKLGEQQLTLTQNFQMLLGQLDQLPVTEGKLTGRQIAFSVGRDHYTGTVDGDRMQGTVNGKPFQAMRMAR